MRSQSAAGRWLSPSRLGSFVLALGWLLASGLVLIFMAILSMGGNGWIVVIPVLVCALAAALQRFRNRLTGWGAGCVVVAGSVVLVGATFAVVLAVRDEVTFGGATASVVASCAAVADLADRVRRARHGRATIAA